MMIRRFLPCIIAALFFGVTVPISPALSAAKTIVLEDKEGRVIGKIRTVNNQGKMVLRDKQGRVVGKYDPKTNKTTDKQGRVVGTGNLLPMLLIPSK
jgi:hypothetical protein